MESLLRCANGQTKRVCVLSWPSQLAFNSIKNLWMHQHTVFPVLPVRSHRLIHLLAESRCDTLAVDPKIPETLLVNIRENLGVPIVKISGGAIAHSHNPTMSRKPYLYESRVYGSTIPVVGEATAEEKSSLSFSGSVLPYSSNWILDAECSEEVAFLDSTTKCISPQNICVDLSTIDSLLGQTEQGLIDPSKTQSIVVDVVSRNAEVERMNVNKLKKKFEIFTNAKIFTRVLVPELGGLIAEISPIDRGEYISVPGFDLKMKGSGDLQVRPDSDSKVTYVGRPRASVDVFADGGYMQLGLDVTGEDSLEVPVPRRERFKKKRLMQPDWRIRQVPIAVYHKKRGFKGQIYYTTKHKGWTFYRSRYYN